MELQDVYKLVYQGVLGSEHMITSPDAFAERLYQELEHLTGPEDDLPELLWEPIRPDQSLGRLNLRPFTAGLGDVHRLISACMETGKHSWGTRAGLQASWKIFIDLCRDDRWPGFAFQNDASFSDWLEIEAYPVVHHSTAYREAYRPAYRLVAQKFLPL